MAEMREAVDAAGFQEPRHILWLEQIHMLYYIGDDTAVFLPVSVVVR